jgi:hypothetical protein
LIAAHVVAMLALAFPSGDSLSNRAAWRSENAQADFADWAAALEAFGVELTGEELERELWDFVRTYGDARHTATTPFRPYARALGLYQRWQMFASPQRHPGELHVDILERGAAGDERWRPIFRSRSSEYTWRRRQLDNNRLRKYVGRFARGFVRAHYEGLADWLASAAAREFKGALRIRVRVYRYRSRSPARVRAGLRPRGRYEHARYFDAETLR